MLGSIDAHVIVVGQGFSALDRNGPTLEPDRTIPTNRNRRRLVAEAGIERNRVHLTNGILRLKPGRSLEAPVRSARFEACRPLLRRTIEVVNPRAVVWLGGRAWTSVQRAFGLPVGRLARCLGQPPREPEAGPALFAMNHCGGLGLVARPLRQQVAGWRKLGGRLRARNRAGRTG